MTTEKDSRRVAIIGAGITGLVAGWSLQQRGWDVTLFERKGHPGGSIHSVRQGGWLAEYGPNTLQLKSPVVQKLFEQLGLAGQLREAGSRSSRRYIVRNGRLVPIPTSFREMVRREFISGGGMARVLLEPFASAGKDPDESLASFVRRRLGDEVLDYAINPFVSGIYAGTPETLSVRHAFPRLYQLEQSYGSLILGSLRKRWQQRDEERFKTRLVSFDNGLQVLPERLASQLGEVRYETEITRLNRSDHGWELIANGVKSSGYDQVLLNIPLYRVSESLIEGGGEAQKAARLAVYPPLSVAHTGYHHSRIRHPLDGFGFRVPEVENRKILGALFSSSLFPGRAPADSVLITTFVGGSRQPDLASLPGDRIRELVTRELGELLGTSGEPEFYDHAFWPDSIPQYTPAYDRVTQAIDHLEAQHPGLHLIGNFRGGISLPDCIERGLSWGEL